MSPYSYADYSLGDEDEDDKKDQEEERKKGYAGVDYLSEKGSFVLTQKDIKNMTMPLSFSS